MTPAAYRSYSPEEMEKISFLDGVGESPCKRLCPNRNKLMIHGGTLEAEYCIEAHDDCPLKISTLFYGEEKDLYGKTDAFKICPVCGKKFFKAKNRSNKEFGRMRTCSWRCQKIDTKKRYIEKYPDVIKLYKEGFTYREIHEITGVRMGSIGSILDAVEVIREKRVKV